MARRALEAARTLGDPRFLGQAQAALAPWWKGNDVPPDAMLLRATLKQSEHDFEGSLVDLDRLLAADPAFAQARLTRATVLAVVGRYAQARTDCAQVQTRASPLVTASCDATPACLSGDATSAYLGLVRALESPRESPARRRGDSLHRREEARFQFAIEHDSQAALALARANWAVQREAADLRILIESAQAAHDNEALKLAQEWMSSHRLELSAIAPRSEPLR